MTFKHCKRCGIAATNHDEHHRARRSKGNMDNTIFVCRSCHRFIEENGKEAQRIGFMDRESQYRLEKEYHEKKPLEE
jgi:predicted metal-binding protein